MIDLKNAKRLFDEYVANYDKDNPKVTNDIFLFIILHPINQSFYLIIFLKLKLILKILLYNMLSVL